MPGQPFDFKMTIVRKDAAKRHAYGWVNMIEKDGQPVVDLQGDVITVDELENANARYMLKYRDAGDMHERTGVATCITSFVTSPAIVKALFPDVAPGQIPVGWIAGFYVHDEELWQRIEAGTRGALSIHGMGKRRHVPEAA